MTESLQKSKEVSEMVECYLCNLQLPSDKAMEIPLTTGGNVKVHPSCMEFYMSKAAGPGAASCGSCSGEAGCC